MSFIRASGLGPLTASNTATIVDPATPVNGIATMGPLVSFAPVTVSGTSVSFTGIPSWARRITVMLNGVSTNGSSNLLIQLGTSSGFVTSGYAGMGLYNASYYVITTTGMAITGYTVAACIWHGICTITLADPSNYTWVESGNINESTANSFWAHSGWSVSLGGVLTQLRLTTINGTDTFDAGKLNVMYE